MKVAVIGNMNNNGFSITRYFRLLGADAHLFQYLDDGRGGLSHFGPENDTWEIDSWAPYIHRLAIPNAPTALLGHRLNAMLVAVKGLNIGPRTSLRQVASEFDAIVGSGIAPAALHQLDVSLDIFFPYSTGVEFVEGGSVYGRNPSWWRRALSQVAKRYQCHGIRRARHVLNGEMGRTRQVLEELGVTNLNLPVPMVFNGGQAEPLQIPAGPLADAIARIGQSDFSIMAHSSHRWATSALDPLRPSKNNDWLIQGFAELCRARPDTEALLVLTEYGPDVGETKRLIAKLGIGDQVLWLPTMTRREIGLVLSRVSMGAGEFITTPGTIWGGTGWETLAAGKPLLNGFYFQEGEFETLFGHRAPPMLKVRSREDVGRLLLEMNDHRDSCNSIGAAAREWFDAHNGLSLARRWLALIDARLAGTDIDHLARS